MSKRLFNFTHSTLILHVQLFLFGWCICLFGFRLEIGAMFSPWQKMQLWFFSISDCFPALPAYWVVQWAQQCMTVQLSHVVLLTRSRQESTSRWHHWHWVVHRWRAPFRLVVFVPCREIASDRRELVKLGITHILNCAQSKWRGGAEYYEGMNITYQGIEAHDSPTFDMSVNFYPASEFMHKALSSGGECSLKTTSAGCVCVWL